MNIKYVGKDSRISEYCLVHKDSGDSTGCGANICDYKRHWVKTNASVTCQKEGCK